MKRSLLALLLVLALCLPTLAACDIKPTPQETTGTSTDNTQESTTAEQTTVAEENTNYEEIYKNPYDVFEELASRGYEGTFEEWVASLAGKDGKSAYELAVENGYVGTVEDWLKSLVGAPGKDGADGKDGVDGEKGDKGDTGAQGEKGDAGVGIAKIEIIGDKLVITYTDGTQVNLDIPAQDASQGTDGLEYYPLPGGTYAVMMGTTKYLEEIVIPSTHQGKAVTTILDKAFEKATNLKSITIPDSVTSIGDWAFYACFSLTSINYCGTEEQWSKISKGSGWDDVTGSYTITYNYIPE